MFAVAGLVGGDLGGFGPAVTCFFKVLFDLLRAGAGGVQVFLGIPFDLRSPALPGLDLITEPVALWPARLVADMRGERRLGCAVAAVRFVALKRVIGDKARADALAGMRDQIVDAGYHFRERARANDAQHVPIP